MSTLERWLLWMLLLGSLGGAWWWYQGPPLAIRPADGVLAPDPPRQILLHSAPVVMHGDIRLQPLARFETRARVLSTQRYSMDAESTLSPIDFALGWGPMSDNRILDQLELEQSARFFTWRWSSQPPLPAEQISQSAANVHMIPANPVIARQLNRVRAGEVVLLRGELVEATQPDGSIWRSSLVRTDGGGGACELLLVAEVRVD